MNDKATLKLSQTDVAISWLRQFRTEDQEVAAFLIDSLTLVSHDELVNRLRNLVIKRAEKIEGPVGLYAEREIRKYNDIPNRLFKEKGRHRRAHGVGPQPVEPTRAYDPHVGSEGIIAWLITELCRERPRKFINHPGPDKIRKLRVRAFFLVSDFIGSGHRASAYLEAAWRVASVRSWWSLRIFRFEVITYSATDSGRALVARHHSTPSVEMAHPCPTIDTEFGDRLRERIRALCRRYDPGEKGSSCTFPQDLDFEQDDASDALGYNGVGALIAFSHGCPNNAPRILHKQTGKWRPLFPRRVTASARGLFGDRADDSTLLGRLERLREKHLAAGAWLSSANREGRSMILLLAALRRGPRADEPLARRTGLTLSEVRTLLGRARSWCWVGENRRLTDAGLGQLIHARKLRRRAYPLSVEPKEYYYPESLRAPVCPSS